MTVSAFKQLEWNENRKVVRFSLDPLRRSSSLTYVLLQNNCINNGVTNNDLK